MDIKELLKRIRIEDIISRYAQLEYKNDDNLKCRCCFHEEETPSMLIQTKDQYFICFGCNSKGNVINFISQYYKISFEEAYNILAQEVGLVPEHSLQLYKDVSSFYHTKISENESQQFLSKRHITPEIVEKFQLGYSGKVFELYEHFKEQKDKLLEINLLNIKNKNTVAEIYPSYFSNRITFPIETSLGLVSIAGRTVLDVVPKYLNLPDNQYYSKHKTFYGMTKECLDSIQQLGYIIIVEGFIDVIRMQSSGYVNTVCCMGVNLSVDHVTFIKRFTQKVVMIYDGDEAGQIAVKRNAKELIKSGIDFLVILLPEKEDPDSFLLKGGIIEDLTLFDGFDVIKSYYTREEMYNILKEVQDYSVINPRILNHYKINLDVYLKKPTKQVPRGNKVYKMSIWTHLALLCETYPELYERLTSSEIELIEQEKVRTEFIDFKIRNLYSKVKNPLEMFQKLKTN